MTLVLNASGQVEQRMLVVDRALGTQWLVASGLAAGERVIVEGMQKVRPGASAKEVPFDADRKRDAPPAKASPSAPQAK